MVVSSKKRIKWDLEQRVRRTVLDEVTGETSLWK